MISWNDVIVFGCLIALFFGILRLSPRLWRAKTTIIIGALLFAVVGIGIAYGVFLYSQYKKSPPFVHTWDDGASYDLQGKPIDPKKYR